MTRVKADLNKGYWNLKRKMCVTTHFSEITKYHNSKKALKYRIMYGIFFPNLSSIISQKCVLPPTFTLDSDSPG